MFVTDWVLARFQVSKMQYPLNLLPLLPCLKKTPPLYLFLSTYSSSTKKPYDKGLNIIEILVEYLLSSGLFYVEQYIYTPDSGEACWKTVRPCSWARSNELGISIIFDPEQYTLTAWVLNMNSNTPVVGARILCYLTFYGNTTIQELGAVLTNNEGLVNISLPKSINEYYTAYVMVQNDGILLAPQQINIPPYIESPAYIYVVDIIPWKEYQT